MTDSHPLWQHIRTVPNFPKQGINFFDITPLLLDHINEVIDALLDALPHNLLDDVDYLVGIEARGFILSSLLAGRLGKGIILLRKPHKLPPPTNKKSYSLEYGEDTLEISTTIKPSKVLLIDDVLATGGTLQTAVALCEEVGHEVLGSLVLMDIIDLHKPMATPVYRVLTA